MKTDVNGNRIAQAKGGPLDGQWLFRVNDEDGDTFVPARIEGMAINRPVYRLAGDEWLFIRWDPDPDCRELKEASHD